MATGFWILLSIMNGQYEDGRFDIMINHQYRFASKYECRDFLREHRDPYITSVLRHYKYKKTIQRILCVPEENVIKFLSSKV